MGVVRKKNVLGGESEKRLRNTVLEDSHLRYGTRREGSCVEGPMMRPSDAVSCGERRMCHRQVCPVISTQAKPTPYLFGARSGGPATLGPRMSSLCRGLQPVLRSPSPELEAPPETAGLRLC